MSSQSSTQPVIRDQQRQSIAATEPPQPARMQVGGRHDYGTRVLQGTGNLAVVMRTMGHGSPTTAMKYQHPELEQVRRVLNGTNSNHDPERGSYGTFYGTVTKY
jgi:hypothetical protein